MAARLLHGKKFLGCMCAGLRAPALVEALQAPAGFTPPRLTEAGLISVYNDRHVRGTAGACAGPIRGELLDGAMPLYDPRSQTLPHPVTRALRADRLVLSPKVESSGERPELARAAMREEGDDPSLKIEDNGRRAAARDRRHPKLSGLREMRERMHQAAGGFDSRTLPGRYTALIQVPRLIPQGYG